MEELNQYTNSTDEKPSTLYKPSAVNDLFLEEYNLQITLTDEKSDQKSIEER